MSRHTNRGGSDQQRRVKFHHIWDIQFQETKVDNMVYACASAGYRVIAANVLIRHGGVFVFF